MPLSVTNKKNLLSRLAQLMAEDKSNGRPSEWPGEPYVNDDGTFGVTAGKQKGGLYAAYFLIDRLAKGGLFEGKENPRTDLDTAIYELADDTVFRVYDEAELFWNADSELQVRITTDKPVSEIAKAIEAGYADAKEENAEKARRKQAYEDEVKADGERDKMPTIVSPEADAALAVAYLEMRLMAEVPSHSIVMSHQPIDPELGRILNDKRPRLRADYTLDPGADFGPVNRFNNEVLPKVFTGHLAVSFNMTSGRNDRMYVEVAGTPARLAADILDHDPIGAREAFKKLQGKLSQDTLRKIEKEIDRHYADEVAKSLQQGLKAYGVKGYSPATFKKNG